MNMELEFVRNLLLAVESSASNLELPLSRQLLGFPDIQDQHFSRWVTLLENAGLLSAFHQEAEFHYLCFPIRLTQTGLDFLNDIRDQKNWNKILTIHSGEASTLSLSVLIAMAERVKQLKSEE